MSSQARCPKCGQIDMVLKVSALHSGGVSSTEYEVIVPIQLGSTVTPVSSKRVGVSQTELSKKLAPPSKPEPKDYAVYNDTERVLKTLATLAVCLGLVLAIWGQCANLATLGGQGLLQLILGIALVGCGGAYIYFVTSRREKQAMAVLMSRWKRAIARWNQLYYCSRDDGVFIPGQSHFVPVDQMTDFLYEK
jgi:hypothetical protein